MTPSLGSRRANKRPTGLPSRSGGEEGDGSRLRIELWSRRPWWCPALRLASSQQVTESRRQGRRRHHAGTGAGAAALLQPLRIPTHPNPRTECGGESRLRLGASVGRRAREMARPGTCKRTAGPAAMMAPASLRFVNLLRLLLDGPRPRCKMAVPYVTRGPAAISLAGRRRGTAGGAAPPLRPTDPPSRSPLSTARSCSLARSAARGARPLPATASLRSTRSTRAPTRAEALSLAVPARASA